MIFNDLEAVDITIEFAIKNSIDSWTQNEFEKINIFIIFQCGRAPGTRPEALGTPGIDSTLIKTNDFLNFVIFS